MNRDADALRRQVSLVARIYAGEASAMSYAELRERQQPPLASINYGAAGIAHALGRPNAQRLRIQDLDGAMRHVVEAERHAKQRTAFVGRDPAFTGMDLPRSIHFGGAGIPFERLLTDARAGRVTDAAALRTFVRQARRARTATSEFLQGVAGFLSAVVILLRVVEAPVLDALADELAGELLERAVSPNPWVRAKVLAFAHGRAGIFHSLLGWSLATKRELPAWFQSELARLDADVESEGRMGAPDWSHGLERTWCNGAAGLVLLWARAYEHTRDTKHRQRARKAARTLLSKMEGWGGDLCCGLGGRAFALLAMQRIDPDGGWEMRALAMGARATDAMVANPGPWPNGLYHGFPGLVCLAGDLGSAPGKRLGFPMAEG